MAIENICTCSKSQYNESLSLISVLSAVYTFVSGRIDYVPGVTIFIVDIYKNIWNNNNKQLKAEHFRSNFTKL